MNGKRGLSPIFMARIALLSSVIFGIQLCGCSENISLGKETETVHIVAYDKGNFKMSGDWALFSDGRSLQIRSNLFADLIGWPRVWLPDEITERDYWRLSRLLKY
ncbi:MAG: hypothetical protein RL211_599 [Pseudomonadota bacterium]|jgi:hypothetical protein